MLCLLFYDEILKLKQKDINISVVKVFIEIYKVPRTWKTRLSYFLSDVRWL